MSKTYELKNNLEYNNLSSNFQNPELYNSYLPKDFDHNLNVIHHII